MNMTRKKKRGWHFKKSFLVFCAVAAALLVLVIGTAVVRSARKDDTGKTSDKIAAEAEGSTGEKTASQTAGTTGASQAAPMTSAAPSAVPEGSLPPPVTNPDEKVLYLTFDDGPSKNTVRILDILDQYNAKATFFVIHTYDGCEAQIKQIHDRGHAVGLHSYSHDFSIYSSLDTYFKDLNQISDLVYQATGERSRLVRFPGGTSNTVSCNYASGIMTQISQAVTEKGYRYFDWDWDSTDASGKQKPASVIYEKSIQAADAGDDHVILLMHDAPIKTTTVDALPDILQYYKDRGYRFDALSETSYTYQHNPNN